MTAGGDPQSSAHDGLSDEQRGALAPTIRLIEAGPGAESFTDPRGNVMRWTGEDWIEDST